MSASTDRSKEMEEMAAKEALEEKEQQRRNKQLEDLFNMKPIISKKK